MEIDSARVFREVGADVAYQLRGIVPIDEGFAANPHVHGPTEGDQVPGLLIRPDGVSAALAWTLRGTHEGPVFFRRTVRDGDGNLVEVGEPPTGRAVLVQGVTIYRSDGFLLHMIDWLGLAAQIGMSLTGRSVRPSEPIDPPVASKRPRSNRPARPAARA